MKCAVEHDLYMIETEEHERMLQQEFLDRAYEEAFEYAKNFCEFNAFKRMFKSKLKDAGLDRDEIYTCIDWLFDDEEAKAIINNLDLG